MVDAFDQVLRACRLNGSLCFEYADPWALWRELLPEYRDRVIALAQGRHTVFCCTEVQFRTVAFRRFRPALRVLWTVSESFGVITEPAHGQYRH